MIGSRAAASLGRVRLLRALSLVLRDERIPRPLRALGAFAVLPIPGPVDEAVLILLLPVLALYRRPLADAWRRAGRSDLAQAISRDG